MKTIIIIILSFFLFFSCTKKSLLSESSVKFTIDYGFNFYSSSMQVKDINVDYTNFYNKYIGGRLLTPYSYNITFVGSKGLIFNVNGVWKNNDFYTLPEDKYIVTGKSYPISNNYVSDSCYINITDTILISQSTKKIIVKAKYDCYLILVDKSNVNNININMNNINYQGNLKYNEYFYYLFINNLGNYDINRMVDLQIWKNNSTSSVVKIDKYPFQYGKYYYLSFINGDYLLPQMSN